MKNYEDIPFPMSYSKKNYFCWYTKCFLWFCNFFGNSWNIWVNLPLVFLLCYVDITWFALIFDDELNLKILNNYGIKYSMLIIKVWQIISIEIKVIIWKLHSDIHNSSRILISLDYIRLITFEIKTNMLMKAIRWLNYQWPRNDKIGIAI